ncbi:MAG: ribonuclease T2 family protein [Thiolinea sp.]
MNSKNAITDLLKAVITYFALLSPINSYANFPIEGSFFATQKCPALRSIRKNTNPGNFFIKPGEQYRLKAKNKSAATHYLLKMQGEQRWVRTDCGQLNHQPALQKNQPPSKSQDYLLTASWQPAFCQTHQAKPECHTQKSKRYDAQHFALHGLWPQPRDNAYCGVNTTLKSIDRRGEWHLLPALELSKTLRKTLNKIMPGTASNLQRHEWYKHGTCYSPDPETYYRDSIHLMQQLNESAVTRLFASNIGKTLSMRQIRHAFEQDFGKGMGKKVDIRCHRKLIGELWINLSGPIDKNTTLADLLKNAPDVNKPGCKGGLVDPVGF